MYQLSEIKIKPDANIREALQVIDTGAMKIALVVDGAGKLLGTLTDGDIRRALLNGMQLDDPVKDIYNDNPVVAGIEDRKEKIIDLAISKRIYQIPLVNEKGHVIKLAEIDHLLRREKHANSVILMAGGLGKRLRPLTDDMPKPMLKLGGRPILESLIISFMDLGFSNFYISLNYLGDKIKNYFGDGRSMGVNISYLEEKKRMGTAGALSLLNEKQKLPLIVTNGDILTGVNFEHLLDYHIKRDAAATMCVRQYDMEVPFGVIGLDQSNIVSIKEKPIQQFYVNAGIYVLNPEVLNFIPDNAAIDMTTVFEKLVAGKKKILSYPIREYWLDIGRPEDFKKAEEDYRKYFNG